MRWWNVNGMRLFVVFVAAILLYGGSAKADFVWARKTDMPTPRWDLSSAVVDGKIYAIGGVSSEYGSKLLSTVEEYDPATNTWTNKADMPTARWGTSQSSAVVDGRIYVIGGADVTAQGLQIVEEYSPATDTWTRKADMPTPRWDPSCVVVDGKIYAIGGAPGSYTGLNVVEQYDPTTDTWTRKADMPLGVFGLCACLVNGKIYAFGGRPGTTAEPYVQEYDPATDTWRRRHDMPVATSNMSSVVLDNKIYVIGGWHISTRFPYTTVQLYDPETDIWTQEADVPFQRALFSAELVNNRIYVIGGTDRPHPCPALSTVYEYGPLVDFNADGNIDTDDLMIMINNWGTDDSLCDIAPMPWGDGIVDDADLEVLMSYWGQEIDDPTLIAHWKLDETEGEVAYDSAGEYDGRLYGDPVWQPTVGMVDGALLLDGIDDCVGTWEIPDLSAGDFSMFAWIKGGAPGQVVISEYHGVNWLMADADNGYLKTDLKGTQSTIQPLVSEVSITDGQWHRVGLSWDGTNRVLIVDDVTVASDMYRGILDRSEVELNIGCGPDSTTETFFWGLIDDVRIYNRAIKP